MKKWILLALCLFFLTVNAAALCEGDMIPEEDDGSFWAEELPDELDMLDEDDPAAFYSPTPSPVPPTPAPLDDADDDDLIVEEIEDARSLVFGDEGDDVTELQQKLTDLHYYSGAISGKFKEGTRAAIRSFQTDFGLEVTGEADAATQALLYSTFYRPLKHGSSGEDVKRMQSRLTELGYYKGKISGNYLDATQSAIQAMQEKNHLESTGEADPFTQSLLYSGTVIGANDLIAAASTATPDPSQSYIVDDSDPNNPVYSIAYTKRLAYSSSGDLVKELQTRLTELGYYSGPISGNFLGKTNKAVKAFQKQNGMIADGVIGEETWNLLFNTPLSGIVLPEATAKPTPAPTPVPYAITVDVNNQVTIVYGLDANNEYTIVVKEFLCSTGTRKNPTPVGSFKLNGRHAKWCYFPKFGSHAQFWTRINDSVAFHSVIYNAVNNMALSTSSYKNLGNRASHGCVRLTVADSRWIYENIGAGTIVTVTEDLPRDQELVASLKLPPLNTSNMLPQPTEAPTAPPVYSGSAQPPLPLEKLQRGDSSEAVYWLQCRLKELGYYNGKCSGTFLDGTRAAVKAYQKDHKLNTNGAATVQMLEMLYADVLATPTPDVIPTPAP